MYGKIEEDYGLLRNALSIYRRGCSAVTPDDLHVLFNLSINKNIESQGVLAARPLYEEAIKSLPFPASLPFALAHSVLEEKLNEIPRARAPLMHMSQFCRNFQRKLIMRHWNHYSQRPSKTKKIKIKNKL